MTTAVAESEMIHDTRNNTACVYIGYERRKSRQWSIVRRRINVMV